MRVYADDVSILPLPVLGHSLLHRWFREDRWSDHRLFLFNHVAAARCECSVGIARLNRNDNFFALFRRLLAHLSILVNHGLRLLRRGLLFFDDHGHGHGLRLAHVRRCRVRNLGWATAAVGMDWRIRSGCTFVNWPRLACVFLNCSCAVNCNQPIFSGF